MLLKAEIETVLSQLTAPGPYAVFSKNMETDFDTAFYQGVMDTFYHDFTATIPDREPDMASILLNIPLTGILLHRIARQFYLSGRERQALIYSNLTRLISQMEIFYTADIGKGLKINHGLGVVIGAHCTIGSHALIYQNTVIGDITPLSPTPRDRPVIGDHLVMFAGAKILGPVTIKDHVIISADATCTKDVDSHSIFRKNGTISSRQPRLRGQMPKP